MARCKCKCDCKTVARRAKPSRAKKSSASSWGRCCDSTGVQWRNEAGVGFGVSKPMWENGAGVKFGATTELDFVTDTGAVEIVTQPVPPDDPPGGTGGAGLDPVYMNVGVAHDAADYDSTKYTATTDDNGYDPALANDPVNQGCKGYSHPDWPRVCPQRATWGWMETVTQPQLDFGNEFRAAFGHADMIWNRVLTLMAQRHASFVAEKWDALYAPGMPLAGLLHDETPVDDPVHPSYGATLAERSANAGGPGLVGEGVGMAFISTPTFGLCQQKGDYVDETNPGHFGAWTHNANNIAYYGYGIDLTPGTNRAIHVFVYSPNLPNDQITAEFYEHFPKFDCP